MNSAPSILIHDFLEAFWRRRTLFIMPILLIVPLGLVYAKFGPKTYEAKTLLLLQENSRDYPLSREVPAGVRMRDQLPSLEALLKSDRVLRGVMTDIAGAEAPTEPDEIAHWVKDFSSNVALDLMGNDFLELSLTGPSPAGLGAKLEVVTARFLDALILTQDAVSASEVVLSQRRKEFEVAEQALIQFKQNYAAHLPAGLDASLAQLSSLKQKLTEKEREFAIVSAKVDALHAPDVSPAVSGSANAADASTRTADVPAAEDAAGLESRFRDLQADVERLTRSVETSELMIADAAPLQDQLKTLETRAHTARDSYQLYSKRYGNIAASGRGPGILSAPERIQLVDPPMDPTSPKNSSLKIALIAVFAALLAAAALTVGAELLDTRVRRASQLASLTGVPVLARLP